MIAALRTLGLALLALALSHGVAVADARTDFLVRMLGTSSQFRVRAQAALALASHASEASVVGALGKSLSDEHPAVRAASATALEQIGDPRAVSWLEPLQRDADKSVRAAATKALGTLRVAAAAVRPTGSGVSGTGPTDGSAFYVAVGVPSGKNAGLGPDLLRGLRGHLTAQLLQIAGVRIAPEDEARAEAERVLRARKMTGYHLESSITTLELRPDGAIRAQVSVVVATYPGRDIRAMLTGGATLQGGGQGDADKVEAISAAFTGALRRLPQAMQAGLARAP